MIPEITSILTRVVLLGMAALFILSKCFFLAPCRAGWLMLLANVVYETLEIKGHVRRSFLDGVILVAIPAGIGLRGNWPAAAVAAVVLGGVWAGALLVDLQWRSDAPATQMAAKSGRVPLPVPRLIVTLRGPVFDRGGSVYEAGDWPEGTKQEFALIVLNPGIVRPQLPLHIDITSDDSRLAVIRSGKEEGECPEPGQVLQESFKVSASRAGPGGDVRIRVRHGDWTWARTLRVASIPERKSMRIQSAAIRRWKYGARAGFVWRGDNDLYDPSTFQSAEGLRAALGLAARYRMPTTVMLSSRLSLFPEEHRAFCERFGWNRHSEEIPDFIRFWREEVDASADQEFPVRTDRPFSAEIGNHCHLHYGTHAAADPGNGWMSHARIGDGNYPWLKNHPCDSLSEQRDNIRACTEAIESILGVHTVSYTPPSDEYDRDTARAVEAAGIEIGNETDATKWQKLLTFPAEHHPDGCERLVELTRMLPRDPVNAFQIAMLKFWMGFARRHGRALVFLAHHHLMRYRSNACLGLTSELLRHVLADTDGDAYSATLAAMGRYWRDVLSERTRTLRLSVESGAVTVENTGNRDLDGLPLEIELDDGRRFMKLISLRAGESQRVNE